MKSGEPKSGADLLIERTDNVRLFAMRSTLAAMQAAPLAGRMRAVTKMRQLARRERRAGNTVEAITLFATAKLTVRLRP